MFFSVLVDKQQSSVVGEESPDRDEVPFLLFVPVFGITVEVREGKNGRVGWGGAGVVFILSLSLCYSHYP